MPAAKNEGDYMKQSCKWNMCALFVAGAVAFGCPAYAGQSDQATPHDGIRGSIQGKNLSVEINSDGSYSIVQPGIPGTVMRSGVEADVDSEVLRSSAYPQHKTARSEFHDDFGSGSMLTVTHTGLAGERERCWASTRLVIWRPLFNSSVTVLM